MVEFLNQLSPSEKFFFGCALFGTSLFVIRMLLTLIGIDGDDGGEVSLGDADVSFKFLSIHGLSAFFMMFGLVAFTLSWQHKQEPFIAVAAGTAAGAFTTWVISKLFVMMKRLQSDGTLDVRNAVGIEGSVYLTIPEGRSGQVRISIQNRLRHLNAVAEDGQAIPTGARVVVARVLDGETLSVRKI
ncbi:MAG TPA: hypothetical protein PKE55_04070 [Kiritimatiellia bacterium]|nr:hypothetical protein [Kiritimatiellia bacterium]